MKNHLLAGLALCLVAAPLAAAEAERPPRTLAVTGTAEVNVAPDICLMSFTVTNTDKKSAARAYQANGTDMNAVLAAVKGQGIDPKEIQTSNLTISPQYHYDEDGHRRIFDGYSVTNTITVKVRDLAKVSAVLDAAVGAGAEEVGYVNFTVENPKKYTADARVEALNAARTKAEKICEVTGVKLGRPLSISEAEPGGWGTYYAQSNVSVMRDQAQAAGETAALSPGQTKIAHTVHITYEIE